VRKIQLSFPVPVLPDGEKQKGKTGNGRVNLGGNLLTSVLTIHGHRGEARSLVQRIKQESTLMVGESLACLLHYLSPKISVALMSGRLKFGTSQRGRSRDSISGIGSTNRKWNLGVTSGFLTLRKE
jgi:hypothetical protein